MENTAAAFWACFDPGNPCSAGVMKGLDIIMVLGWIALFGYAVMRHRNGLIRFFREGTRPGLRFAWALFLWSVPFTVFLPAMLRYFPVASPLQGALFVICSCLLTIWYYDYVLKP